jgi:hypothetical protein
MVFSLKGTRPFLYLFFIFILFFIVGMFFNAHARVCVEQDGELVMQGSTCLCPPDNDQGLAVVCGTVRSARVTKKDDADVVGLPLGGVTVAVYEADPLSPTGKIAGRLTNLYSSTSTTEKEGKYSVFMRRVGPGGNRVYVAYLCNGWLAGLKSVSSMQDIVELDDYVNCFGFNTYSTPPVELDYINKDTFLGCETQEHDPNIGYSEQIIEHYSADGAEQNYDGRFGIAHPLFPVIFSIYNVFPQGYSGAYWSRDCEVKYPHNRDLCDTIENPMDPAERLVNPFLMHLPKMDTILAYRTWETRAGVRQMAQNPKAGAQYMSSVFGNCIGDAYLRQYGTTATDQLISCEVFKECTNISSPSVRNTRTTASAASLLSTPGTWEEVYQAEGDPDMEVCMGPSGVVRLGQIKPPWVLCEVGDPGCDYLYDSEYWLPELMYRKDGARYGWTDMNINDSFYSSGIRGQVFNPAGTEAQQPHELGGNMIFPKGGEKNPNNSPLTGVRVSSETPGFGETGGVLTDWVRSPFSDDTFEDNITVWNIGGDVRNLCNLSSSQGIQTITVAGEGGVLPGNWFRGNPNHRPDVDDPKDGLSRTAGSSTYSTSVAIERDAALQNYLLLDIHDSFLRYLSGDGGLLPSLGNYWHAFWNIFSSIASSGQSKTFAERSGSLGAPVARDDMIVRFPISEHSFTGYFPLPGPNYTSDEWGGHDQCYPWRQVPVSQSCNTYAELNDYGDMVSRTCRVDSCGNARYERRCTCQFGQIIPGSCIDTLQENDCTLEQRRQCAIDQVATSSGSPSLPADPTCGMFDPDPYYAYSYGPTVSGCALSTAGPYRTECYGDIEKDLAFRAIQRPTDPTVPQIPVDPLFIGSNQQYQSFRSPFQNISYRVGASLDYRTSNDVSGGENLGRFLDGMPTEGVGTGASSATLTVSADPVIFFYGEAYNPVNIHCNDGLGNTGPWDCTPIQLPPPVEPEDLQQRANPSCSVSGSCPAPALVELIANAAAADFNIPAALIIAEIYNEGRVSEPFGRWDLLSYDSIYNASFPWYGRIQHCNDMVFTAQGPYGWITTWFNNVKNAINVAVPGRGDIASKCNFLDSTYAMAQALANSGGTPGGISCGSSWEQVKPALYAVTYGTAEWSDGARPILVPVGGDPWIEGFVRQIYIQCGGTP